MKPSKASTPKPVSTYRLQLRNGFSLRDAERIVPYIERLGVSDLYLSPVFRARPGSTHGYDVCHPGEIDPALGGEAAFRSLARAVGSRGMGIVLDIVPNHVAADARHNPWWRDLLRHGRESRYERYFDVDWEAPGLDGKILLPVLGDELGAILEREEIAIGGNGDGAEVRYFDHSFPLAPGTESVRPLGALLERQHYRLASWREAATSLNYRRFFDVTGLAGVRVEDPEVFRVTHALVLRLVREGLVRGLRIDHVDGLRDPAGYLRRLRAEAGEVWLVVEKILAKDEELPASWPVDGTTGYEFLRSSNDLYVSRRDERRLRAAWRRFTGDRRSFAEVAAGAGRFVVDTLFAAEVDRVARAIAPRLGIGVAEARDAVGSLVSVMPVYRFYPETPASFVDGAFEAAGPAASVLRPWVDAVLRAGGDDDAFARLQQLAGAVHAKRIEDTAFYRHYPLLSRCEVGGGPGHPGDAVPAFHRQARDRLRTRPCSMLATATHDTKRGEDTRARLNALGRRAEDWIAVLPQWAGSGGDPVDPAPEWLLQQTMVAVWNPEAPEALAERLDGFLRKALREGKERSSWLDPDLAVEDRLVARARSWIADPDTRPGFTALARRIARAGLSNALGQVLLKIACPGVTDVYQGSELRDLSLVDPDNRRPVDFAALERRLREADAADAPSFRSIDDRLLKIAVTARALRFRREHPELFLRGSYRPLRIDGGGRRVFLAFTRRLGEQAVIAVTTLDPFAGEGREGSDQVRVRLPVDLATAACRNVLTGKEVSPGRNPRVRELLGELPVALIAPTRQPPV